MEGMRACCGIDWAEDHHDIAVIDADGTLLCRARIGNDPTGLHRLLQLLGEAGDTPEQPIPVAIETTRGLLVACLRTTRPVYAINPMAVARYRDRYSVARAKSDRGDALVLANILRTDAAAHRPLPADSDRAQAVTVLARAQQDAVWTCQQLANQLRTALLAFFPAAITAFCVKHVGLASREARAVLTAAPTPARAAKLTRAQLRAVLRRAGRERNLDAWAERLHATFRAEQLRQPSLVELAMGQQVTALIIQLSAACRAAGQLAEAATTTFRRHPDAWLITSLPGLGELTGARVLAELGDDPNRFADARALKAYAGAHPSPGPAADATSSWPARSRISGWPASATSGRSPPSPTHQAPEPTTTADAPPETTTPPPSVICSTASSASSTTAEPPGPPTTSTRPSPAANPPRLDPYADRMS